MTAWLSATARALRSRRLATSLLLTWLGLLLAWIVPFQLYGLPQEQLRAIIYTEPFFQWVYVAISIVTVACLWVRIGDAWRRARRVPSLDAKVRPGARPVRLAGEWNAALAMRSLAHAGFRKRVEGDGWAWGVRYPWSALGTVVSHLAIVAIVVCAAAWLAAGEPFVGSMILAEGERFDGDLASYVETQGANPASISMTLETVTPRFHEDILLFTHLDCTIADDSGRIRDVRLGHPWYPDPTTQVAVEDFGWTTEVLAGRDATTVAGPTVYKLKVFPPGSPDYIDVAIEDARYRLKLVVYGDFAERDGQPGVRSFNLGDPRISVSAWRVLSNDAPVALFADRIVAPGETLRLTERDSVAFLGVGTYGKFRVSRVFPFPLAVALALTLLAGFAMRLTFPRTEALIAPAEDGSVQLSARSEVYGSSSRAERVRASGDGERGAR